MPEQSHALCEYWTANETVPSSIFFSFEPARRAVLFIHGFMGGALGTWPQFDRFLPAEPALAGHDIYFYGYDGLKTFASESALEFQDFLRALLENPAEIFRYALPPAMARPIDFRYEDVLIVAHSLGAIVTRRALVTAHQQGAAWPARVRSILFAPAHNGTRTLDWLFSAITGFDLVGANLAVALIEARYVVTEDLRGNTSMLADLRTDISGLSNDAKATMRPKKVVHCHRDRIVVNGPYLDDPAPEVIRNTTHQGVCKPGPGFRRPLEIVLEQL